MMDALIEAARQGWAVILLVAVPIGAVVGFLLNMAALRKAARERHKLDLEIAKLRADASDRDAQKKKLELEIEKLKDDASVRESQKTMMQLEISSLQSQAARQDNVIHRSDLLQMQVVIMDAYKNELRSLMPVRPGREEEGNGKIEEFFSRERDLREKFNKLRSSLDQVTARNEDHGRGVAGSSECQQESADSVGAASDGQGSAI